MFQISSCVITAEGVEIRIPSGTYLTRSEDVAISDGVEVCDQKESFHMLWEIFEDDEHGTEAGLRRLLADARPDNREPDYIVQAVQPVEVNGLTGHCVAYRDEYYGNYEARFQLSDSRLLVFTVVTQPGVDIREIMGTKLFQEALQAARKRD